MDFTTLTNSLFRVILQLVKSNNRLVKVYFNSLSHILKDGDVICSFHLISGIISRDKTLTTIDSTDVFNYNVFRFNLNAIDSCIYWNKIENKKSPARRPCSRANLLDFYGHVQLNTCPEFFGILR